jgi:hypothetical protein
MDNSIRIKVGRKKSRTFEVKKSLLSDASPVLRRMMENANFVEAATGVLTFPEDDPEIWSRFLEFLQSSYGSCDSLQLRWDNNTAAITLRVFADKYNIARLENLAIMDLRYSHGGVDEGLFDFAFQNARPLNPVRNLLIRRLLEGGSMSISVNDLAHRDHAESPAAVCQRLEARIISTRPSIRPRSVVVWPEMPKPDEREICRLLKQGKISDT